MDGNIYKHFAVLAALVFWCSTIYMLKRLKGSKQNFISTHAASNKKAYLLFATAVTIETVLYTFFAFKWFIPTFGMSRLFEVLMILLLLGHLLTGLVPETKGLAGRVHWFVSYSVAWLFIPTALIVAATDAISVAGRISAVIAALYMLTAWAVRLRSKRPNPQVLIFQAVYIAVVPLTMIIATYTS